MAYGQKVFKVRNGKKTTKFTWRCRYKLPNGDWGSEPGFPTKAAAESWGEKQEAAIEAGTWIDPNLRKTKFGTFARTFMSARKKRGRTVGTRWDNLELHILPRWEHTAMGSITWFDVDTWQQSLPVEDVRRGHCVSLMSTIMTAAADAQMIPVNPLFARRRTRDTSDDESTPKEPKLSRAPARRTRSCSPSGSGRCAASMCSRLRSVVPAGAKGWGSRASGRCCCAASRGALASSCARSCV